MNPKDAISLLNQFVLQGLGSGLFKDFQSVDVARQAIGVIEQELQKVQSLELAFKSVNETTTSTPE